MNPLWRIPSWFPLLNDLALNQLHMFHVELIKFNKAVNLVSPTTVNESDLTHFSDSILAYTGLEKLLRSDVLADFGSGGGFPAIVFAILDSQNNRQWIANDVDQRKIEFLKHCQRKIGLKNFVAQVSDLSKPGNRKFSQATCRAFAPMREIVKKFGHNIEENGEIFALKGKNWEEESGLIEKSLGSTWNIQKIYDYSLPSSVDRRHIIRILKK